MGQNKAYFIREEVLKDKYKIIDDPTAKDIIIIDETGEAVLRVPYNYLRQMSLILVSILQDRGDTIP